MHLPILKLVVIAGASALGAVFSAFRHFFWTGEDPADDRPRAVISEFLGTWLGLFFLIWSFTAEGRSLQWTLRGVAALAAIVGIGLSVNFGNPTEVPESPDKEPSGFKNDLTNIHLE